MKASLIRVPNNRSVALRAALRACDGPDKLDPKQHEIYRLTTSQSLNQTIPGSDMETGDTIASDEPNVEESALKCGDISQLEILLGVLSPLERDVLEARNGLGNGKEKSFKEIGVEFGITRDNARRLHNNAIKKIRSTNYYERMLDDR
jgi:DNA-directed RNA polymerase sigma subunit (sigma70/sigma32)